MTKIFLKKNEERRIRNGHLWVFSNEIDTIEGEIESGDFAELYDNRKNFLGRGFYNKSSLIAFRLLTRSDENDLREIFRKKILAAANLRKDIYPNRNSYRLVFSESDFLPGLIIDKFNNTYVLQVYSYGMDKNINLIVEILKNDFSAVNIFSRNEAYFRKLEGLSEEDFVYLGGKEIETIDDGVIRYRIDFENSQKTGFFFDQSDNRFFVERFCKNKTVLDAFCNSGGFGLHASYAGASEVTFVDSSATEIENVKNNYTLNGLSGAAEYITSDVFDYLQQCISSKQKFDVVMIDPPAFAKSKKNLPTAIKGYEKLNRLAMEVVKDNGILVSSSCSYHLKRENFIQLISNAAVKAGKTVQLLYTNNASLDHPQNPFMEETVYLKFAVLKVIAG